MFLSRKFRKCVAGFLLLNMLNYIVFPSISYALTSGPTAPESNSFEPVDTTDMVNLLTGDFTYNVPLLEVPGPAGGYPLSLSYHAGIQLNQDASWVGLGWNLNPGAITRTVNGFPDDYKSELGNNRTFWEGGETTVTTVGLSYGIANFASVSAGISIGNDRYKGYGIGGYGTAGLNVPFTKGSPTSLGINVSAGMSPWGDPYTSAGLGIGISGAKQSSIGLGASLGLQYNFTSGLNAGLSGGVSYGHWNDKGRSFGGSLVGASISTGGTTPSLSIGGGTSFSHNQNTNKISTSSNGFNIDIPIYFGINVQLGHAYSRYWIDEAVNIYMNGSLFYPSTTPNVDAFDFNSYDTYDLLDTEIDMAENDDATKVLGGTFADYDQYNVTAQGLGGNIKPYHYQQTLYRQNIIETYNKDGKLKEKVLVKSYPLKTTKRKVGFRFVNDFSNRIEYDAPDFASSSDDPLSYTFSGDLITGKKGSEGFNHETNQLVGSKHVEWFTNAQILQEDPDNNPFEKGFLNTRSTGFVRESGYQIGGFMITNESGVTYHYALPVYSYDEYMKSENTQEFKEEKGDTYNEHFKPNKYAYTWLLTAVTGPDYVDVNNNHLADEGDYGYWVEFDYGKWTDDYLWRNPLIGKHKDLDGDFENFSSGKKELYYLDAIRTATHTALFVKKLRNDGKSATDKTSGGSCPIENYDEECAVTLPTSVLALDEIFLIQNNQLNNLNLENLKSKGKKYEYYFDFNCSYWIDIGHQGGYMTEKSNYSKVNHFGDYVIDVSDFDSNVSIRDKSIRVINFDTDYSLCQNTPNSFVNDLLYQDDPEVVKDGKLTLKQLNFLGKGGKSLLPPTSFSYVNNPPYEEDHYDMWGFYKSDFDVDLKKENENLARMVSDESALNVDAWSLTSINTPSGSIIDINYQSDSYDEVVLSKQSVFRIKDVIDLKQGNKLKIILHENVVDFFEYLSEQIIDISIVGVYYGTESSQVSCFPPCLIAENFSWPFYDVKEKRGLGVKEVNSEENFIVIENASLYNYLKHARKEFKDYKDIEDCSSETITCTYTFEDESAWPKFFPVGHISVGSHSKYGGGLRVESISIRSLNSSIAERKTNYNYRYGVTSFEPFKILPAIVNDKYKVNDKIVKRIFKKYLLKKHYNSIALAREIPGPGVMYKTVTVGEETVECDDNSCNPEESIYQFEVFSRDMIDVQSELTENSEKRGTAYGIDFDKIVTKKLRLKDYSTRVGSLRSITLYNSKTKKIISKTENHYLHDNLDGKFQPQKEYEPILKERFHSQGLIEETFTNARLVKFNGGSSNPYPTTSENNRIDKDGYQVLGIVSKKEKYPTILTGQTNTNFKTGMTNSSEKLAFDFYSGAVTKTLSKDSYGNSYVEETVPAYTKYSDMGSKVLNSENKNMLTQAAATYSYKVEPEHPEYITGLVGATVQTWSDEISVLDEGTQPGIWRKKASFFWDGQKLNEDGTYDMSEFDTDQPFDFENPDLNNLWEKSGELTLYDIYSHGLEATDINDDYVSTRMDPFQYRVIASASNASYNEIAYSGAEHYSSSQTLEGGVSIGDGELSTARSHTGKNSLKIPSSGNGFVCTLSDQTADLDKMFRACVWLYVPGDSEMEGIIDGAQLYYKVNGATTEVHPTVNRDKSKNWYRLEIIADPQGASEIEFGCRNSTPRHVYFDDFRVSPLTSEMSSYVYDQATGELNYILDNDNFYTKFEYDAMGRLIRTSIESLNFDFGDGQSTFKADKITGETIYNYGLSSEK